MASIRLDGDASIQLKNGQNIISVATKAPKIPYVERICIADNKEDANIDHTAYDEFFANAKLGIITEPKQSYEMPLSFASNATNAASMVMRTSQTIIAKTKRAKVGDTTANLVHKYSTV